MNIQITETTYNVTLAIDELGKLQAHIADLRAKEDRLKDIVKSLGAGVYEGNLFRATVSMPEREKFSDELKARVKENTAEFIAALSHQYRTAHITHEPTPTVSVRARKTA